MNFRACSSKFFGSTIELSAISVICWYASAGEKGFLVKLIDGMQVDGQRIDLIVVGGFDAVGIGYEFAVFIDVVPYFFVVGVENMGAVNVFHYACFLISLSMAIACNVVALINNNNFMTSFRQFTCDDGSGKASTYD